MERIYVYSIIYTYIYIFVIPIYITYLKGFLILYYHCSNKMKHRTIISVRIPYVALFEGDIY